MIPVDSLEWWHTIDLGDGVVTPGQEKFWQTKEAYMHLDEVDFTGKSVLDVGCCDGKYSFYAEERGATSVFAMDKERRETFYVAKEALKSYVEFANECVECEDAFSPNEFDVVLFLGVLYHLQNPLIALKNLHTWLKPGGVLIVETAVSVDFDADKRPLMEFCETYLPDDERKDATNWWYPNRSCVEALLRTAGFKDIQYVGGILQRGCWRCAK